MADPSAAAAVAQGGAGGPSCSRRSSEHHRAVAVGRLQQDVQGGLDVGVLLLGRRQGFDVGGGVAQRAQGPAALRQRYRLIELARPVTHRSDLVRIGTVPGPLGDLALGRQLNDARRRTAPRCRAGTAAQRCLQLPY